MTSITWAGPRCVQEPAAILAPQNRTQGRCEVFATMSSLQSIFPIVASALYTSFYNATSDFAYPWSSSYLFMSGCLFITSEFLKTIFEVVKLFFQVVSWPCQFMHPLDSNRFLQLKIILNKTVMLMLKAFIHYLKLK